MRRARAAVRLDAPPADLHQALGGSGTRRPRTRERCGTFDRSGAGVSARRLRAGASSVACTPRVLAAWHGAPPAPRSAAREPRSPNTGAGHSDWRRCRERRARRPAGRRWGSATRPRRRRAGNAAGPPPRARAVRWTRRAPVDAHRGETSAAGSSTSHHRDLPRAMREPPDWRSVRSSARGRRRDHRRECGRPASARSPRASSASTKRRSAGSPVWRGPPWPSRHHAQVRRPNDCR